MSEDKQSKVDEAGKILIEELTAGPSEELPTWRRIGDTLLIPLLAVLTGLILGAILLIATSETVWAAWGESPLAGLNAMLNEVRLSYGALFTGSFGDPAQIIAAIQSGDSMEIAANHLNWL